MSVLKEDVEGFDPKHDGAISAARGRIKDMYEKLHGRGREEAAERLRRATGREQQQMVNDFQEFDPKHDGAESLAKLQVQNFYDAMSTVAEESDDPAEAERAEAAASELRRAGTLNAQHEVMGRLRHELDIADLEERFGFELK